MFFKRKGVPRPGELVICTVKKILPHAAFVTLEEFDNLDAMLHVSEISARWIKNIKDYVTEGKRLVCKVMQVDELKRHVDVSLKRVTNSEKNNKLNEERTSIKMEKLIEVLAKKMKIDVNKSLAEIGCTLIDEFGSLSDFYEIILKEGVSVIDESEIDSAWKKELKAEIQAQLDAMNVKIQKDIEVCSYEPDGINRIKNVFAAIEEFAKSKGVAVGFVYVSSPRYMLDFTAKNYKEGELFLSELLKKFTELALKNKVLVKTE